MEKRTPSDYFRNTFRACLEAYISKKPDNTCTHHNIPKERAVWIDSGEHPLDQETQYKDSYFWLSWYCLALSDQVIHSDFNDKYDSWVLNTGGHPIPMRGTGMGCIGVCRADEFLDLIEKRHAVLFRKEEVEHFKSFFLDELLPTFAYKAGIDLDDFLSKYPQKNMFQVGDKATN